MHNFTKYFKETKGFDRFINQMYIKYQTLSRFSGNIKLKSITKEESDCLSRLFGTTYKANSDICLSIKKFLDIMYKSKYENFSPQILIEEYMNVKLTTKKEDNIKQIEEEKQFYQNIINNSSKPAVDWLKYCITNNDNANNILKRNYKNSKKELEQQLLNIMNLINNLPPKKELLSIYASKFTSDPHYLDIDTKNSNLYLYALSYLDKCPFPETREQKIKLLSKYNLEIDNISNFIITYNLLSDRNCINEFTSANEPLILNIKNIINTKNFNGKNNQVFILENPSLLTEILAQNINASIIISGGFPNLSLYLLLDKLIATNNQLYYNGDIDPEGVLIASKLKEKYPNIKLFCYDKIDYENNTSKNIISNQRLNKLNNIVPELEEIKNLLLERRYASYQENNKNNIINYIKINGHK